MPVTLLLILTACVVRYGPEPEAGASAVQAPARAAGPRPDYAAIEAELLGLLEQGEDVDADMQARLHAAAGLSASMRSPRVDPDAAVEAYLRELIAIEARSARASQPGFVGETLQLAPIQEEVIQVGPSPAPGPSPEPPAPEAPDLEGAIAAARAALEGQDYLAAIEALKPVRAEEAQAEALYLEAVDGWVHQERERAGALFLEARGRSGEDRARAMREVEQTLAGLLRDYPETSYRDAIERNLELVRKETAP